MVCRDDTVMLIVDSDWGGKDGEVCFLTVHLDNELTEGRVTGDMQSRREDDRLVLRRLWLNLWTRESEVFTLDIPVSQTMY